MSLELFQELAAQVADAVEHMRTCKLVCRKCLTAQALYNALYEVVFREPTPAPFMHAAKPRAKKNSFLKGIAA